MKENIWYLIENIKENMYIIMSKCGESLTEGKRDYQGYIVTKYERCKRIILSR